MSALVQEPLVEEEGAGWGFGGCVCVCVGEGLLGTGGANRSVTKARSSARAAKKW